MSNGLPTAAGGPDTDRTLGNRFTLWLGHPKRDVREAAQAAARVWFGYPPRGGGRKAELDAATAHANAKGDKKIPLVLLQVEPRKDGKKGVLVKTTNLVGAEVSQAHSNEKSAVAAIGKKIFNGDFVPGNGGISGVLKEGYAVTPLPAAANGAAVGLVSEQQRGPQGAREQNGEPLDWPEFLTLWPEQTADRWARERDQAALLEYTRLTPINTERSLWRARLATLGVEGVQTRDAAVAQRQGSTLTEWQQQQRAEILKRKEEEQQAAQAAREAKRQDDATEAQRQAARDREAQRKQTMDPMLKTMLDVANQDALNYDSTPEKTRGIKAHEDTGFVPEGGDLEPLPPLDLGNDPETRVKPGSTEESKGRIGQLRAQLAESEL